MEGVGSRMGRASSRYGPSATAAVFNGPVRKWKKKWVHVSLSATTLTHHHNGNSHSHTNNNSNSRLLLCRWTPAAAADSSSDEPPKRKFRYTPIAVLGERRKAARKVDHDDKICGSGTNQPTPLLVSKRDELNTDVAFKTETQDPNISNLDLGLCVKGHNSDRLSLGLTKESQMKNVDSGGYRTNS